MRDPRIDAGNEFDWGRTSEDYATWRSGYPPAWYATLQALGIGLPGQRILDLATGTGELARHFAAQDARVSAMDLSPEQIAIARRLAEAANLTIDFSVGPAEAIDHPSGTFDVISAAQCWVYFDATRLVPRILDQLAPDGVLVLTHLNWLPLHDPLAAATEALVLEHNGHWSGDGYDGTMPPTFGWSRDAFDLRTFHVSEYDLPFSHAAWRGRIRACRGIGASLPDEAVARFDAEHAALLRERVPDPFTVRHQATLHVFMRKRYGTGGIPTGPRPSPRPQDDRFV